MSSAKLASGTNGWTRLWTSCPNVMGAIIEQQGLATSDYRDQVGGLIWTFTVERNIGDINMLAYQYKIVRSASHFLSEVC